ncbi:TspO/MBR family protein [Amnibacterium sp.]|uniref:TspO/MBR family protein n=1 Tax=Amnibacterium sp. TaxID=1872496 RepID=UPI00260AEB1F|nr:TspO/MBR family protein [Amnibacterium sp.]MCU1472239.1 TspO protein [Amnibacterium sp.]
MSRSSYVAAGGAVLTTAVLGVLGTDVSSSWYTRLKKPPFQPPGAAFGIAWTVLYALITISTGRTLTRIEHQKRRRFSLAFALNLLLNVGWTWVFFRGHRAGYATVEILALQASNVDLARRTARVDRTAALLLAPYLLWVAFASVLTGDIHRRNR